MFEQDPVWQQVLRFWFGEGFLSEGSLSAKENWPLPQQEKRWFRGGAALDAEIAERFGHVVDAALWSEMVDWENRPLSRLALILVLDQFTRNIYRGEARAFAGDHRAVTLVNEGLAIGMDEQLPWAGRVFFYMPLMHAEDIDLQRRCITCFERARDAAPADIAVKLESNIRFAREHAEIIERFGRFPYRNRALGRESTGEELAFLEHGPSFGQ
ncbi:DUF924 domain-containing protein [Alcanivorax sp. JB21]|uniref:DUF924 family protein n=1 Tax=Alcanivorax limicola TaxID=2874102 RepID=UPI001CBCBF64|nr:DUF924 family protein [Alcanivorax limicola]MBZ2187584.1 DUF924 domain-containing protein [Alcanivorax limicola]